MTLPRVAATLAFALAANAQLGNTFKYVGDSGVSAQQLFLGTSNKLYFLDKTENNPVKINGHPAWATEVDIHTWEMRAMDVVSNSFCAGGTVLGDGRWLNVGGNQAVIENGDAAGPPGSAAQSGQNVYGDADGRKAVRILTPCDDQSCNWIDNPQNYMTSERWYPTLETLEDGSAIIFGGCQNGGYVNTPDQDNPTFEYFPPKGANALVTLNILVNTMPVNLFPLVFLLPSGMILIQAERQAVLFDRVSNTEYPIDNIPDCVRVYPASAATTVLPMTPANNWTASVIFCGGSDLNKDQWVTNWPIVNYPAHQSCVTISPDIDLTWHQDDNLDAGRTMGQFINLPDGRLLFVNGAATGTAGYGKESWAIGQSYADNPSYQAYYYDGSQPPGSKWSKAGTSSIPRMYHSSATLLPDGSVAVSGSNPNADFVDPNNFPQTPNPNYKYGSDVTIEVFYPDYFDKPRPKPKNLPTSLGYGGDYFNLTLSHDDLIATRNINNTKVVVIRTGFSTHAMNMGQRHVELASSFTTHDDGGATLHVAPMPPNPAIMVPGPALLFVVVNGVPSEAGWVMVGSGKVEVQSVLPAPVLPRSTWSAEQVQLGT